jgi:hypothetical protein
MESILNSIKALLGIADDYDHFDAQIIMLINSSLSTLTQLGVGPSTGFKIEDDTSTWTDFLGDSEILESVKEYIYLDVRLAFDPPQTSVIEAHNRKINELAWRLSVAAEP